LIKMLRDKHYRNKYPKANLKILVDFPHFLYL